MDDMRGLVLLVQSPRLLGISVCSHQLDICDLHDDISPKIALRRGGKYPSFAFSLPEPRSFRFCVDDVLDCLSNKSRSSCHEYHGSHDSAFVRKFHMLLVKGDRERPTMASWIPG